MRVLLIGGSGQLGTEIRRSWSDCEIESPPHDELDFEDAPALGAAIAHCEPDVVVNAAAFHNVDRCEERPERALAVNAIAVERAARLCRDRGIRFVTVSTDYVFHGETSRPWTEDDAPHPVSVYGVSKFTGELLVECLRSDALIVRTCGVYGVRPSDTKGYTFVDRILRQARAGEPIRVVHDVIASPTFAGDLAAAIGFLVGAGASGLYHACNAGPVSWYTFACEALRQAGIDPAAVEPIEMGEWKTGARRPRYSALSSAKLAEAGHAMPSWQAGIAAYLDKIAPPCS